MELVNTVTPCARMAWYSSRHVVPLSMYTISTSAISAAAACAMRCFCSLFTSMLAANRPPYTECPSSTTPPCVRSSLTRFSNSARSRLTVDSDTFKSPHNSEILAYRAAFKW